MNYKSVAEIIINIFKSLDIYKQYDKNKEQ